MRLVAAQLPVHVWATDALSGEQRWEPREEDGGRAGAIREYAECRALVPGEAVLVVDFLAVAGEHDDRFPLLAELLAAIVLPGGDTPPAGTPTP